jgi:hypothetical protein
MESRRRADTGRRIPVGTKPLADHPVAVTIHDTVSRRGADATPICIEEPASPYVTGLGRTKVRIAF